MQSYYFLVSHNYQDKESTIIELCNKYDGLHLIESYCEEYIRHLVGNNKNIIYYSEDSTNRVYGYFIEKSKNDLNKMTVRHKYIKSSGFFCNEVVIENLVSYKLAKCDSEDRVEPFINNEFCYKEEFGKVLNYIKEEFNKIDSDINVRIVNN